MKILVSVQLVAILVASCNQPVENSSVERKKPYLERFKAGDKFAYESKSITGHYGSTVDLKWEDSAMAEILVDRINSARDSMWASVKVSGVHKVFHGTSLFSESTFIVDDRMTVSINPDSAGTVNTHLEGAYHLVPTRIGLHFFLFAKKIFPSDPGLASADSSKWRFQHGADSERLVVFEPSREAYATYNHYIPSKALLGYGEYVNPRGGGGASNIWLKSINGESVVLMDGEIK